MSIEIIAVIIAAVGGGVGVIGNTWNKEKKIPTVTGWITFSVIFLASTIALIQISDHFDREKERLTREERLSYHALIEVYGPLSMWLDDFFVNSRNQNDKTNKFPPELYLDIYEELNKNPKHFERFAKVANEGHINPNGSKNFSFLETFSARYRLIQNNLDESINHYGAHISSETLEHLITLRSHSLFRFFDLYRARVTDKPCRGAVDQIALNLADNNLEKKYRARCEMLLKVRLRAMTRDLVPLPPFKISMKEEHQKYCTKIGYRRPFCAWAEQRSSSGEPIGKAKPYSKKNQ